MNMTKEDLFGMRYYIILSLAIIGFYMYSGFTGWKWIGDTKTENEKPVGRGTTHGLYRYHK